jgi:hypothetical protein
MWKPGQLVTICGEKYQIKRYEGDCPQLKSCSMCAFSDMHTCLLSLYEPKYKRCYHLIPIDCYFERLNYAVRRM